MMKKIAVVVIFLLQCSVILFSQYPGQFGKKLKVPLAVNPKATAFELNDVKISGGTFKDAMDRDMGFLLALEPNRLLHRFYLNAGLPTKGAVYGGWESDGLSGHSLGHYLSAISMAYAVTNNAEFKNRVDYIVNELERCQKARKTGYIGAIPNEDTIFSKVARGEIRSGGFDLNGGWSPWYTVHKVMAGLVDAYLYADNTKALDVVSKMADWTESTIKNLTEEQRLKMLNCEYGGMNEVLVNIYSLTGNKRYLELSRKFHDEFVMGQLAKKIDPMPGKHSNTNVPKAVGAIRRYEFSKAQSDSTIAAFFWSTIVHHHSYVIGGNSSYEYCGEPDKLNDRLSDNTCETCNTYNMLKLTKHLFCLNPDNAYADYYERALYNHILASQNPTNGMMCYFVPLRMGTQKQFSDSFNTFTCCVGSGMENHVKYAESIYFKAADGGLYVNLFIPSELKWKDKNLTVKQETSYPESNKTTIIVEPEHPAKFPLYIRNPWWANNEARIMVNGKEMKASLSSNGYWEIIHNWKGKTVVEVTFPMGIYTESIPDNPRRIAFLYGPVVLAGQLGKETPDPILGTPVMLTDDHTVTNWMKPVTNQTLTFQTSNIGKPRDIEFKPFYKTYDQYYSVYFDYFTNAEWDARKTEYEAEKKRQQEIEAKTIDNFRIGEMQPERDHNLFATEQSYISEALGRAGREARAGHYFTFEMKVTDTIPVNLLLTYIGDDKNRLFDILVDGVKVTSV
ncbi:MAG TPA: beta-L-arabinofuranosidase domain-containing protein, partial [Bacteroidales bacterium]|nr:beta-L-arabinofuranosidase domain-containing protein [Bacteroidales bacterium]